MWVILAIVLLLLLCGVLLWRCSDLRAERRAWDTLAHLGGTTADRFDPAMVQHLPDPARRFFNFTFENGAVLRRVTVLEMDGELSLGSKDSPNNRPMTARQILAPPYGLVWRLRSGGISGSDALLPDGSWTRFWLGHLLPVVRVGGTRDHQLSAFGRLMAEAAMWAPAALLPGDNVRWEQVDAHTARAICTYQGLEQSVDLTVAPDGRPRHVLIQRWSNENPERVFRRQPFGGTLSRFQVFDGVRLPTYVEGGNHFGTDRYFPFYKAHITGVSFTPMRAPR